MILMKLSQRENPFAVVFIIVAWAGEGCESDLFEQCHLLVGLFFGHIFFMNGVTVGDLAAKIAANFLAAEFSRRVFWWFWWWGESRVALGFVNLICCANMRLVCLQQILQTQFGFKMPRIAEQLWIERRFQWRVDRSVTRSQTVHEPSWAQFRSTGSGPKNFRHPCCKTKNMGNSKGSGSAADVQNMQELFTRSVVFNGPLNARKAEVAEMQVQWASSRSDNCHEGSEWQTVRTTKYKKLLTAS